MRTKTFFLFGKKKIRLPRKENIVISKRQKFVASVLLLSFGIFTAENFFGSWGVYVVVLVALLSNVFFFVSMYKDIRNNFTPQILILPFFLSLAFGFFYFLVPGRFLTRLAMTSMYAIGLYSLYLSQNIFLVASIRTIGLLSGARIVSFVISLISYFFLCDIIFSLHLQLFPTALLILGCSFFLILHCLWAYALDEKLIPLASWSFLLSLSLFELSFILWFWPSSPTVVSLFLTGIFYTVVGITQAWLHKSLFKGVIWEYVWVSALVLSVLLFFTSWKAYS